MELFKDYAHVYDGLEVINPGEVPMIVDAFNVPQGKLFEVLGTSRGKKIVKEIAHNQVVVGGAITAMEKLTGVEASWHPTSINAKYGITATPATSPVIALFGIGKGGSNLDFGSVISPDMKQRDLNDPIPLRYGPSIAAGADSNKYFMKVQDATNGTDNYSWYLKEFAIPPTIHTYWKNSVNLDEDGTEINSGDIDSIADARGIETFAEFQIDLNVDDGHEYFERRGLMTEARYNELGFYTGSKNADGTEYANVQLYSVITFNNRDLSFKNASQFLYRVYTLT